MSQITKSQMCFALGDALTKLGYAGEQLLIDRSTSCGDNHDMELTVDRPSAHGRHVSRAVPA